MKKKISKLVAVILSLALVVTSASVYHAKTNAEEVSLAEMIASTEYNVALGKEAAAYPAAVEGEVSRLTDGVLGAQDAAIHVSISKAGFNYYEESYATIDLGDTYDASTLEKVVVQYRYGTVNQTIASVVGKTYSVQYSVDGENFTTVATTENTQLDEERMTIDDVSNVSGAVRYVRIYYPQTSQYGMQVLEAAVLDTDKDLKTSDGETVSVNQETTSKQEESKPVETTKTEESDTTKTPVVTDGRRHSQYMYLVSVSTGKVVQIDEASKVLKANGDISLLDDVEALPNTALYYTVPGTDNRFEGYVALRSPYNNQSIQGQAGGMVATGGNATAGWEIVKLEMQPDGTIAILSTNGDNYVTVDTADDNKLKPNSKTVGDAQKFNFVLPANYSEKPEVAEVSVSERTMDSVTLQLNVSSGLYTAFEIYRSETEKGEYIKVAEQVSNMYKDEGLDAGKTYFYKAVTVAEDVKSDFSAVTSAKTLTSPMAAVPTGLDIQYTEKDITVSWDEAQYATSYIVYRSTGKYSEYTKVGTTDTNSYKDTVKDSVYNYYYKIVSVNADDLESEQSEAVSLDIKLFGDTINLYSPTDDVSVINKEIKEISDEMMPAAKSEFSKNRYAIAFKPGAYNINTINVGFYTQVLGLGATPLDVSIKGINVDSCGGENTLINFWRGVENLSIMTGKDDAEVKWGTSQAAPLRRMYVQGKLHFDDIGKTASGGYVSDTYTTGQMGSWSQQQFFVRNSSITGGWYDGCWNMVFVGCENAPQTTENWGSATYQSYTNIEKTEIVREKPFLYLDDNGEYQVFVPGVRKNAVGVSWSENNMGEGTSISIDNFYIAKADTDNADTMNKALAEGKSLILTPGLYNIDKPLKVENANTIILGLGLATITCTNADTAIQVADVDGVSIAGIIAEAGEPGSESLIEMGDKDSSADHSNNPSWFSDVYVRVGGYSVGSCEKGIVINSNNVIGDHFWLWRADHGAGAKWDGAKCDTGLEVNGDNVNVYGLFCEHFQKHQTIWNGENGKMYFYQSELPYDVPTQAEWMSNNGTKNGYASYKVADHVQSHEAYGLGVYEVFIYTGEKMNLASAIEVSSGTKVFHACTNHLSGDNTKSGTITHVVNESGGSVGKGITQQGAKVGIDYYPEDASVLKTQLLKTINQYKDTEKGSAEDTVWNMFKQALKKANDVYNNDNADESEISKAQSDLVKAYNEVEKSKNEHTPASVSTKKGVASWWYAANDPNKDVSVLKKVGTSWVYNWGTTKEIAQKAQNSGMEYVPMIWGQWDVNDSKIAELKEGKESGLYKNLLAFNEPDLSDQSNMTVEQALQLWPKLEETGLRLGSPAGAAAEDAWVADFMEKAKEKGYRVDFLTVHVYQDFTHPESVNQLKAALERLYAKYQIPIWITEIGNVDVSTQWWGYQLYEPMSHTNATKYITEMGNMLESLEFVERYSWFVDHSSNISGTEYTRLFDVSTNELTPEGEAYKAIGKADDKPVETTTPDSGETTTPEEITTPNTGGETTKINGETTKMPDGDKVTTKAPVNVKRPARVKIKKVTSPKKRRVKIRLKKVTGATGYKIQISLSKKFKKGKKYKTKTYYTKKLKFIIKKKLKSKKRYYVRVKAYKLVNGKKLYSKKWSKRKKIKVK
ncbi:MAG: hypothetical protein HFG29_06915 [Eubacterium sp.]|nr:hypothetical protein [Eubacterium sp.]